MAYRDARGRFIGREEWELAHLMVYGKVPRRKTSAPLTAREIQSLSRKEFRGVRVAKPPASKRQRKVLRDIRPVIRGQALPSGQEYEWTITTKGGTPRNDKTRMQDPRKLHLKIRVTTTAPMTSDAARLLLDRAVRDRAVPPGLDLHFINWEKGQASDTIDDQFRKALREFQGAMRVGATRFEKVEP